MRQSESLLEDKEKRAKYEETVRERALDEYIANHSEAYAEFEDVRLRRRFPNFDSMDEEQQEGCIAETKKEFLKQESKKIIPEGGSRPKYRRPDEFKALIVKHDIEQRVMAEILCKESHDNYHRFVEAKNDHEIETKGENAELLDPESEYAICYYYAQFMAKNPKKLAELMKSEGFDQRFAQTAARVLDEREAAAAHTAGEEYAGEHEADEYEVYEEYSA